MNDTSPLHPSDPVQPVETAVATALDTTAEERRYRAMDRQIRILEQERRKFAALISRSDAAFLLIDRDSRMIWGNRFYLDHFVREGGRPEPDTVSCHQAVCRKRTPCESCPMPRLISGDQVVHLEASIPIGDRFRHIYITAVPVVGMQGELEQALYMLQDISGLEILNNAEKAVRSSEQRFRSIFEQAGVGMVSIRADGTLVQANPTFATMVGYTEAGLMCMKVHDLLSKTDREVFDREFAEVEAGRRRVVELEQRFLRRDGTEVWCHSTAVWQFDDRNRPAYSVVLVQDISENKFAEQALERSQRRYEALVHSIDGIVWEADPKAFRFSFVSKQTERILGYPTRQWLTQPRFWRNQIHPEDLDRVTGVLNEAVAGRYGYEIEYRMIAADGREVWIRDSVSVVVEAGDVAKLRGLMVDITEKKQAEEALRHSEHQLRQSQKMEAIGRLAGGIAHDFNNLLTAITGYGDLLIQRLGESNPLQREALEIAKAAQRAADLTSQLLAFSRQQVLQPKVLDLKAIVSEMEHMLRRVIGEHIELVTRTHTALGAVRADPGQVHQVLLNLVVNARDAMESGGRVIVQVANVELDESCAARLPEIVPGAYVMLAVSDTGTGMDEETQSRLFEPFFTTKEPGKGTGLGLSTVYGIVRQSGGHVAVDSTLGVGTTFRIYLPRVEMPEADLSPPCVEAANVSPGTETVLLVEDDDSVRELAREILALNGYTVVDACNGAEALTVFERSERTIDILVTDLVMPQLGGRELARMLTESVPEMKVLFLSGYTDSIVVQQGMLAPGSYFLQKPFTPAQLAHKVREALEV